MGTKKDLRTKGKDILSNLVGTERESKVINIHKALLNTSSYQNAKVIGCTISQEHEIDTKPIIEQAWKDGKTIAVPKCNAKQKELTFRKLTSFEELETVYFGLKEPKEEETEVVTKERIDLMLVPGLMFDQRGYRIGYGGGFYDRYLEYFNQTTIALATEEQLMNQVPNDPFDIPVQHLITELGLRY
ncbi:5-formyltetrahydrofolate cyclo-ligase [Pontibacillus marinus]|uniref:5-formyltetrahydrofolate cyclo-ligase n=1 Tax=Pontibacillus marinus BH030004 = DSM 16465 TaxID=1385511 RepID=A0A0A5G1U0_9BACI|nr:5-formyltetrahydrofolate cyclo-ligase [Pontibacillus marinus]KGX85025.1 hypothetical protein N783_15525 [Pontibacillus marinus BH030004 = DSM 16465]